MAIVAQSAPQFQRNSIDSNRTTGASSPSPSCAALHGLDPVRDKWTLLWCSVQTQSVLSVEGDKGDKRATHTISIMLLPLLRSTATRNGQYNLVLLVDQWPVDGGHPPPLIDGTRQGFSESQQRDQPNQLLRWEFRLLRLHEIRARGDDDAAGEPPKWTRIVTYYYKLHCKECAML